MAMVIDFSEAVALKVRAVASARGISPTEVLVELVTTLPDPPVAEVDWLEAFIGCGASGDTSERSMLQLRDELSAAQLAGRS